MSSCSGGNRQSAFLPELHRMFGRALSSLVSLSTWVFLERTQTFAEKTLRGSYRRFLCVRMCRRSQRKQLLLCGRRACLWVVVVVVVVGALSLPRSNRGSVWISLPSLGLIAHIQAESPWGKPPRLTRTAALYQKPAAAAGDEMFSRMHFCWIARIR